MSDRVSSCARSLVPAGTAIPGLAVLLALAGCAGVPASSSRLPGERGPINPSCTLRAVVNIRQGSSIRSETDLVDVARRLGITLTVLQSMGRDTKMVVFRENGPPEACEDAMAALRDDLRIESIERR
jgi:hypothetical protein